MAQPPPLPPYWNDSQVSLLRKILTNLDYLIENGGGGGGVAGVNRIIAGTNVSISPVGGQGNVTVNSTASGNMTRVAVPAGPTSSGSLGQYAQDAEFFYVATGTNAWARTPIADWTP